ncbi:NAD-dependent epimerase/dehydratase family protein [Nocardioides fonticola]|uniref:NAD-dependent epimerase/dehydratase family protein n=1 Tax=Nocardioides fonticola TaxID=450363 RepID=A0ABP7XLR6_9ACTN
MTDEPTASHVVLTGGTGYIGRAVLAHLLTSGHRVTAIVRSQASAQVVDEAGATPLVGDLFDSAWLAEQLRGADALVHTAAGSDADDARLNDAVIAAALEAFAGTEKPFVHTGGIWTYGANSAITEDSPADPPAITAWRVAGEEKVLTSGLRASVVRPGIVYGHGGGIAAMALVGAPRDAEGRRVLVGSGEQHWTTVHVEDLADLYVRVLEQAPGGQAYLGVAGASPTVRELGEALGPVVAGSGLEAVERFGAPFAEALLLDQQAVGNRGAELGWTPSHPTLVELLAAGYPADR